MTGAASYLPLTILEEFLLLALDDDTGQFYAMSRSTLDCVTAGAVLMDLSLRSRIDNDLKDIFTVDMTPTGDDILDPLLRIMSLAPVMKPYSITHWLGVFMDEGEALRTQALRRLEARGIIRHQDKKILWVFETRRYPIIHNQEIREVKSRILDVILRDAIPTPHDIMITALAQICGLFHHLLNVDLYDKVAPRIDLVCRMDLISQAVGTAAAEIDAAIAMASGFH